MKSTIQSLSAVLAMALLTSLSPAHAEQLRLHAIFDSDMVLQRGKPVTIWGWATPSASVSVQLGTESDDLLTEAIARVFTSQWDKDGKARLEFRRTEEAKLALEILERIKTLGQP